MKRKERKKRKRKGKGKENERFNTNISNLFVFLTVRSTGLRLKITWFASYTVNPLTPMSDQDRISPYYIYTMSCKQVMRIKKNINYGITE